MKKLKLIILWLIKPFTTLFELPTTKFEFLYKLSKFLLRLFLLSYALNGVVFQIVEGWHFNAINKIEKSIYEISFIFLVFATITWVYALSTIFNCLLKDLEKEREENKNNKLKN